MTEWTIVFSDAGTSEEKYFRPQLTKDAALTQAADLRDYPLDTGRQPRYAIGA